MNKIGMAVALVVVILGCLASAAVAEQTKHQTCRSFDIDYSTVIMPDRFGTISTVERTVFEKHEAGMLVRYSRPERRTSWIDVFVYPICLPRLCSLAQIAELENDQSRVRT